MAFGRILRVVITSTDVPANSDATLKSASHEYSAFDIECKIKRSILHEMNTALVTIYNLNKIAVDNINTSDMLTIYAGYVDTGEEIVYNGFIADVKDRKVGVDYICEIYAVSIVRSLKLPGQQSYTARQVEVKQFTWPQGTNYGFIVHELCSFANLNFQDVAVDDGTWEKLVCTEPFTAEGSIQQILMLIDEELKALGWGVYIDNNNCVLYSREGRTPLNLIHATRLDMILSVTRAKTQFPTLIDTKRARAPEGDMAAFNSDLKRKLAQLKEALRKWYDAAIIKNRPDSECLPLWKTAETLARSISEGTENSLKNFSHIAGATTIPYYLRIGIHSELIVVSQNYNELTLAYTGDTGLGFVPRPGDVRLASPVKGSSRLEVAQRVLRHIESVERLGDAFVGDYKGRLDTLKLTKENQINSMHSFYLELINNAAEWEQACSLMIGALEKAQKTGGDMVPIFPHKGVPALNGPKFDVLQVYNPTRWSKMPDKGGNPNTGNSKLIYPQIFEAWLSNTGANATIVDEMNLDIDIQKITMINRPLWNIHQAKTTDKSEYSKLPLTIPELKVFIEGLKKVQAEARRILPKLKGSGNRAMIKDMEATIVEKPTQILFTIESLYIPGVRPNGLFVVPYEPTRVENITNPNGEKLAALYPEMEWTLLPLLVEAVEFDLSNYVEDQFKMVVEGSMTSQLIVNQTNNLIGDKTKTKLGQQGKTIEKRERAPKTKTGVATKGGGHADDGT